MPVPRTAGVVCALFAVPVTPYAVPWAPLPVESAKTIRSKTGLAETQRMASFHKLGRCVENVCKRGSVLSLFVRRVMGPGPDVQWLSSEMRNASSTCSYYSSLISFKVGKKGQSKTYQTLIPLQRLSKVPEYMPRPLLRQIHIRRFSQDEVGDAHSGFRSPGSNGAAQMTGELFRVQVPVPSTR